MRKASARRTSASCFNLGSRFDSGITDQCNTDVNPVQPANCAALGVPDDYVQLNPQVSVDTGGNPDLQPETSETFTAGFTWDIPLSGSFERLLVEANYYDITIDGAIQAPDAQDMLDACIATLDPLVLRPGQPQPERHDHEHRGHAEQHRRHRDRSASTSTST